MKKPQQYYSHKRLDSESVSLHPNWELIEKIGEGSFGEVYKVFNSSTSSIDVLKVGKKETDSCMRRENDVLREMRSSEGFAKIKTIQQNKDENNNLLMMSLLGANLQKILTPAPLSVMTMKRIAYQLLKRLRELHRRGYVHRDLKPENILLGNCKQPHMIYLVDFGLTGSFRKASAKARNIYNGEIGTIRFCSVASHLGLEQFPKDDLESLGYVLIYLVRKDLPWIGLGQFLSDDERCQVVKQAKLKATNEELSKGINCLKKYMAYVRQLKIGQLVDYERLLGYFDVPCKGDCCYQFCREDCMSKKIMMEPNEDSNSDELEDQPQINIPMSL